ncbi:MAG: hypothetical protein RDU14_17900 [Melioribacteraceae bacterium]|nr:hypothetical protein [Melioribacteraceae bacterium]
MKKKYCEFATDLCPNGIEDSVQENKIFAAYSSHNPDIVKIIEEGLKQLNRLTDIRWQSWSKDMDIENSMIFCEICKNISSSKAVLIELSDLNFNVLFEYGYSIAIDKKIHPTVNENFDFNDIERFIKPLLGIGIGKYENNRFSQKFVKKRFWEKEKSNLLMKFSEKDILDDSTEIETNSVLFIKNNDKQDISEAIEWELTQSNLKYIIDDPQEESNNIIWYCKQLKKSFGVIIDLGLSGKKENLNHFLKCAFLAGLSIGSGRRTLILNSVHAQKPSDIILLVNPYSSAKDAKRFASRFLSQHQNSFAIINSYVQMLQIGKESTFSNIDLGDYVAENDLSFIERSFIETPEYSELFKTGYKLFIGRKGTGKSAAFQKFKMTTPHNSFVVSKLFNQYNLDDIYNLTTEFDTDNDKNKVVTAFWKFVLLSLIAKDLHDFIIDKKNKNGFLEDFEQRFLDYFDKHCFFDSDKSVTEHLVEIIDRIKSSSIYNVKQLQSEFYQQEIITLLTEINSFLKNSKKQLFANIDGLDTNICLKNNPSLISLILFNLHEVCSNLFGGKILNSSVNLFIREDIYDTFKDKITQKDKVKKIFYKWDKDTLLLLINKRLQVNNIQNIIYILSEDFTIKILMQKMSYYVFSRPRDYIFFFNHLIQIARFQKLDKIDNRIFNVALDYYSIHIFESMEAEILTLPFKINFGEFMNGIKHLINDKDRILLEYLQTLLEKLCLEEKEQNLLIAFLLKVEFMVYIENNTSVEWSKLIEPETKLRYILNHSKERKTFIFHPIIKYLLEKHF